MSDFKPMAPNPRQSAVLKVSGIFRKLHQIYNRKDLIYIFPTQYS
jgi:hypothetical protein